VTPPGLAPGRQIRAGRRCEPVSAALFLASGVAGRADSVWLAGQGPLG